MKQNAMYSLETKNLRHSFNGKQLDVNNLNLQVPKGSIFGFLGKNGAGKTTSLKLVLGLLKKQEGEIFLFGEKLEKNRIEILKRIGSLIESPSFYAHLNAVDNLTILQKIYQCPKERIDEVLSLVGLSDHKHKIVSKYSLGMKQRLSIAIALLHQPELLILDEPTNGLDPKGIIEIRELLIRINSEFGTTIIVSSHLLSEIERMVHHIAIINKGSVLFQGKIEELKNKASSNLTIETNNPTLAIALVSEFDVKSELIDTTISITHYSREIIPELIKKLVMNDISIYKFNEQEMSLESIFLHLTKN